MQVLITGASGFVGQNLVAHLEGIGHMVDKVSMRKHKWQQQTSKRADVLIHLAGLAHDVKNASKPEEYFEVNYGKTKELFNLFLKSEIKDFIHFSSVKAVADTVHDVLKEDVKGEPQTPYGQSKLQAEEYLLNQHIPDGKRLIILRPCMIHGPGNKGNLNLLYKVVKNGIPYPLGSFDNKRSFLSIDNLNFIINEILTQPEFPSGVYNVADDVPLSTNELIKIIGEGSGTKGRIWNLSKRTISGIAKIGDALKLPLNSERLKKLTESYVVSNEKIKNTLGINTLPISSKDGLIKTIKSFEIK